MFAPSLDPGNVTDLSDTSFTIISDKSSPSKRDSHMLVAPSSSTGTVFKPGSVVSTSASSVVHAGLTLLDQSQMTYHLDAWLTTLAGLTRKNLSNIAVPPPAAGPPFGGNITVLFGAYLESDPLSMKERPAEELVTEAEKSIQK